jgi:uncharacterized protein with FMN-binding domain
VRRAAAAILGTIAGTTLLVGAKLGTHTPDVLAAGDGTAGVDSGSSATPVGGPPGPGASGSAAPAASGPVVPGSAPAAGPAASAPGGTPTTRPAAPPPTAPAGPAGGLKNGSFTGPGIKEKYGTITVTITVSGGRITDVSGSCAGCRGDSQQISGNAFGKLRQEALSAQSASVATVSGATYTSGAYKSSLQAAITAARA